MNTIKFDPDEIIKSPKNRGRKWTGVGQIGLHVLDENGICQVEKAWQQYNEGEQVSCDTFPWTVQFHHILYHLEVDTNTLQPVKSQPAIYVMTEQIDKMLVRGYYHIETVPQGKERVLDDDWTEAAILTHQNISPTDIYKGCKFMTKSEAPIWNGSTWYHTVGCGCSIYKDDRCHLHRIRTKPEPQPKSQPKSKPETEHSSIYGHQSQKHDNPQGRKPKGQKYEEHGQDRPRTPKSKPEYPKPSQKMVTAYGRTIPAFLKNPLTRWVEDGNTAESFKIDPNYKKNKAAEFSGAKTQPPKSNVTVSTHTDTDSTSPRSHSSGSDEYKSESTSQ